jgi:hypothetical protein
MSNPATIALAPNQLGLTNPKKAHGLALLALALFLGVLLAVRAPQLIADVRAETAWTTERILVLATTIAPAILAAVAALVLLSRGGLDALSFFVPAGAPKALVLWDRSLPQLLVHRVIDGIYPRPRGLKLLLGRLFPRLLYLTPPHRRLVGGLGLPLVLLVAAVVGWLVTGWFPGFLLLALVVALGALVGAIFASRRGLPGVHVFQTHLQLTEAGNPGDLFNGVRQCLDRLQEGPFPNRLLGEERPQIGLQSSSNLFEAAVLVETQPLPVRGAFQFNALLLDVAAVLLGVLGWVLLLVRAPDPAQFPEAEFWKANIPYWLAVGSALIALELSRRLFRMAWGVYNTFRFRSDVFWLRFTGTYTASRIGMGDGRGGQFFTHRDRIQSDVRVDVHAARAISECTEVSAWSVAEVGEVATEGEAALEQPRYLVEAVQDPQLGQRVAYLLDHLRSFRDTSDTLAGVRLLAPAVEEILGANLQLTAQGEAARVAGAQRALGQPAPGALPRPVPVPVPVALPPPAPAQPAVQPQAPVAAQPAPTPAQPVARIIACPRCGQQYRALSGQRARFQCARCQQVFDAVVP